ncbi:MAG: glycosyltransferase family 2 protein [Lachnospiraceae bacterium]|nr:glycosyltransferase family 2 protein [Lachnospiraceae bacterium]
MGWATADDRNNSVRIYAVNGKGQEIPCEVTRSCRPDVGLLKYQDTKAEDIGVFLEIPCKGIPYLEVKLEEVTPDGGKVVDHHTVQLNSTLISARNFYKKTKRTLVTAKNDARLAAKKVIHWDHHEYDDWFHAMRVTREEWGDQRKTRLEYRPKFSIVVPLYHTPVGYFRSMVRSVLDQSYTNWELILVNASPEDEELAKAVRVWKQYDKRIRVVGLSDNMGIAGNTCAGINHAEGDFIAFMDHDDMIESDALYCYARALNENPAYDVMYSDEDKVGENDDEFFYPHFKSDFNPDLLCSNNYICHFLAVRADLLRRVGGPSEEFEGAQDYDLILRLTEQTNAVYHCPRVLYHWRSHSQSTAAAQGNKNYAITAGVDAINAHYRRVGIRAFAQIGPVDGWYTTRFELEEKPMVSVLIPNKDHIDDLDKCIQSLFDRATYENYEIIVIENNSTDPETFSYYQKIEEDSRVRVVYWDREFNYSAINNFGAKYAKGEYLLLLNNDVELITPDIFENMLGYCMRRDVGIVGAKLLYDDHTVQHAGVLVGAGGLADHVFKGLHEDDPGYMGRAVAVQDVSAVTAACLMIRKSVYEEIGGLEEEFQVAFNDVDLCLKVRAAGYLVVYDADVRLYHYESKSRGSEDTAARFLRFGNEMRLLNNKWDILGSFVDPYYNPNFSYMEYYKLNHAAKDVRKAEIAQIQRERYGKEKSNDRHSKLQWKKILKKVPGIR